MTCVENHRDRRVVWIEWIDSHGCSGWLEEKSHCAPQEELRCTTCGFVLEERDDAVTVSSSLSVLGHANDGITIPRVAIMAMWDIEIPA